MSVDLGGGRIVRIKRRKKFVFGNNIRAREQIRQGGLASIRITNHCGDRPLMSFASFTLDCARFAHCFELSLKPRYSLLDAPAINLQLCFAGPTGADPTGLS